MLLIQNGRIKPIVGEEIENGSVLIGDDGKILAVGVGIAAPEGAQIIDAEGRLVTPGLVEAHCHIGLGDLSGSDHNEKTNPITPELRVIDGINPQNKAFSAARQGGITTACITPGSANIIGGTVAALKCAGNRVDDMIVKHPVAMKCAFGENPKRLYGENKKAPMTRMAIAGMFREFLFKAKHYYEEKQAGKNPAFDMKLEAMIPVMAREIPLKAHAHRADDIFTAIRIAKEFDLKMTLDHCTDGALIAKELAEEGYPALIGPSMGKAKVSKYELLNKTFSTPSELYAAGVPVAIITDANVTSVEYLAMCAGFAIAAGLPEEEGWRAVTINAATYMGIADRVGSLERGKDGDVVIWQADPLHTIGAEAYVTVIDGKVVYQA